MTDSDKVYWYCETCCKPFDPNTREIIGPRLAEDAIQWIENELEVEFRRGVCAPCREQVDRMVDRFDSVHIQ